jgi:hemolysin D
VICEVDIATTGVGRIIPDGQVKYIQSFETGIVAEILVRDATRVKADSVLIRLDTKDASADEQRTATDLAVGRVEFARLKATIDYERGVPFDLPEGSPAYAVVYSENLMRSQINEITALISQIDADIREKEANIASILATIQNDKELLPILEERENMRRQLLRVDAVSRLVWLEDKQRLITLQGDLRVQKSHLHAAQAALDSFREKRQNTILKFRSDRLAEIVETQRKMLTVEQDHNKAQERLRRHSIVAPIAGTVQDLTVYTIGGVITPSDNLMTIVPFDSRLIVEAFVSNRDVGFVQPGQNAQLKVTTFDYRQYGIVTGKVITVSRDAIRGDNSKSVVSPTKNQTDRIQELKKLNPALEEGPIFKVEISLDQTIMNIDGKDTELTTGMSVDVNILTSRRRIIDFFLAPFQTYQDQAFRQR